MHRFAAWGLSAALAGAAAPLAVAADSPPGKPWYSRVFGGSSAAAESPPAAKTFAELPARSIAYAPLDPDTLTQALKAEQEAWGRRVEVCTKLREIAAQQNDDELYRQATDLELQATALYDARVSRLGVKSPKRSAASEPARPLVAGPGDLAPPAPAPTPEKPPTPAREFREVQP